MSAFIAPGVIEDCIAGIRMSHGTLTPDSQSDSDSRAMLCSVRSKLAQACVSDVS